MEAPQVNEGLRIALRAPQAAAPADDAFSYALAAASAERNAGQALETHGAGERGAFESALRSRKAPVAQEDAASPAEGAAPASTIAARGDPYRAPPVTDTPPNARPAANPSTQASPAKGAAIAPLPVASLTPPPPQAAPPPPRGDAVSAAALSSRNHARAEAAPAAKPLAPPRPTPPQEFLAILARRLADGGAFEIRLEPHAIGRIIAQVHVTDAGAARVALTFDNPSALDLFRNDAAALETALADAGFNARDGLSFELAPEEPQTRNAPAAPSTPDSATSFFRAAVALSGGGVDLII